MQSSSSHLTSALAALFLLGAASSAQARAQRIRFAPGASSKVISLALSPRHPRALYTVRARAGQKMSVLVSSRAGSRALVPDINVTAPSGESSAEERPKAQRFDVPRTEAGDYTIEVAANQMASNSRSGTARLKVWMR
jgi:nucleoid-associated protein YgaU